MRVYRPSSLLMRKDSNSPPDKGKRGEVGCERWKMNVAEARRRRGNGQENGITKRGKSQVGLAK